MLLIFRGKTPLDTQNGDLPPTGPRTHAKISGIVLLTRIENGVPDERVGPRALVRSSDRRCEA